MRSEEKRHQPRMAGGGRAGECPLTPSEAWFSFWGVKIRGHMGSKEEQEE